MRIFCLAIITIALGASPAFAAKCYINEFNTLGKARGEVPDIAQGPAIASQVTGDFNGGAVQSSAFNTTTSFIRVWCDTQASLLFGSNPTAAATDLPIAANTPEYFGVPQGSALKLSVHTNP